MKGGSINCIITGESSYFPPKSMEKKASKFGSLKEFEMHYVSIPARKLLRQGLTVDEVRERLNVTAKLPDVDLKILYRLKLLKKKRKDKSAAKRAENEKYLRSREYQEKMRNLGEQRANMSDRQYIEDATGGPGGCQVELGGTCQRPDIFLSINDKACDGCSYYEHCQCYNRRLSREKRIKRRRR
ncbi:hypothetical protein H8E06_01085 [bacterium]|nr:hypothetical protein [bacterium]